MKTTNRGPERGKDLLKDDAMKSEASPRTGGRAEMGGPGVGQHIPNPSARESGGGVGSASFSLSDDG